MSALGLTADQLTDYLNVTCQANNKSNTTAQALMEAMIGCGGAAKSAGMDYKQTAAALGILANNGVKGAEAGTALNSMLVRMTTKDVAQKAFKELGVSIYDSSGQMRNMQDILVELNGAMSGLTQEQKNNYMSAIAGTNYYTQFGYLLEGVKEGADGAASTWTSLTEAFDNSDGALMNMANQMNDTLPAAMAIFNSAVDDAKIRLCQVFAPMAKDAIKGVADALPSITDKVVGVVQSLYDKAVPAAEDFAKKAQVAFEKVKPVLDDIRTKATDAFTFLSETGKTAFRNIKTAIETNKPAIDKVIAVALDLKDKLFQAFNAAKPAITFIATTAIPAVVNAIMKIIGAAATVYQKLNQWGLLKPIIIGIAGAIAAMKMVKFAKDTIQAVTATKALVTVFLAQKKAMLANIAAKAKDLAETAAIHALYIKDAIVKGASTAATWAQTAAMTAWNAICAVGTAVTTALGAAFTFLTSPIGLVIIAITAVIAIGVLLYKNWDTVKEKASQLGDWIVNVFNNFKEKCSQYIQEFANKFPEAFAFISSVFESFKQTATNIFGGIKTFFQGIIQFFTGVFTGDWSKALEGLKNIFSGAFKALSSLALAPLNALKGVVTGAFNAIDVATGGKLTAIKNKVKDAFSNVKSTIGNAMSQAASNASAHLETMKSAYTNAGGGIKGIVSGAMAGIQTTTSTVMSAINTATGGKLEQLKNSFSEKLEGARSAALSKFESIKSGISEKLEGAKSIVRSGLSAISGFFSNVKLSLPHIKIPHFNISGGQAPWGIAGKGTAPKISVDWYKNGGILTGPTIFGANGNSLLGGGEAGKEAVLPLSELWSNMKTVVAGVMGSQPNAATEAYKQASELANGNSQPQTQTDSVTKELYNNITTNNTVNKSSEKNSSDNSSKIVYQPQIIIQGNASKEDVQSALDMSQEKFNAMMAEYERQNRRVSFA